MTAYQWRARAGNAKAARRSGRGAGIGRSRAGNAWKRLNRPVSPETGRLAVLMAITISYLVWIIVKSQDGWLELAYGQISR